MKPSTIQSFIAKLENLQPRVELLEEGGEVPNDLAADIKAIGDAIRELADTEQERFDDMSESRQESERGEQVQEIAQYLAEAADACDDSEIDTAIEALGNI